VLLEMELPGISPDEVDISIENDMLTVRGEKREERQEGEEEGRYFLVERSYGTFSRSFSLPPGVDADQVSAKFDNGLLTIRIPQGALPQPRRIQIDAGREEVSSGRERSGRSQARARNGGERKEERVGAGAPQDR
jgi:HSP20 family protein